MSYHPLTLPHASAGIPAPLPLQAAVVLLAGGKGTRLHDLTARDSKPAVAFAGTNRIVDFAMANAVRSGVGRMLVATQHAPASLHHHLPTRWGHLFQDRGLDLRDGRDLFRGTADAVRRLWPQIEAQADAVGGDQVLILAADHVYDMNHADLLAAHRASGAAVTIACDCVPLTEAGGFGVMQADAAGRITGFAEKPARPAAMIDRPDRALASMGIYVFDRAWLRAVLFDAATPALDFGQDVIPDAVAQGQAAAWRLPEGGYWRDVGTLDALRLAQLDFVAAEPARLPFPGAASDWYLGRGSIAMPGALVPASARLTDTLVGPGAQIPPGLITGQDAAEDARWFTRTPAGTVLITQTMLDRRASHARIRRSVTPLSSPSSSHIRGLHA